MGARALVAYERPDGDYNLHYAHWGATADLAAAIGPATPFGGADRPAEWAARLLRELLTATGVAPERVAGRLPDGATTRVDPWPLAVGVPRGDIAAHVDFGTHEAVHLIDRSFDVRSYLVVPFSLAAVAATCDNGPTADRSRGALLPVEDGFAAARERATGAREALGAAVDCGVDPTVARGALWTTLSRWAGADRLLVTGGAGETEEGP